MKKVKFEDLLVGAVLPGLLVHFILMALSFSIPAALPLAVLAAVGGALAVFLWHQHWLRPALRKTFSALVSIIMVGVVVSFAFQEHTLTVDNSGFTHSRYLTVSASAEGTAGKIYQNGNPTSDDSAENQYSTKKSSVKVTGTTINVTAATQSNKEACQQGDKYHNFADKVTVTITNTATAPVKFTISYTGSAVGTGGEITLAPGGTHTFTVESTAGYNATAQTGSADITNVRDTCSDPFVPVSTTVQSAAGGTVSVQRYNESNAKEGDPVTISESSQTLTGAKGTDYYVLTAAPGTGYSFYGWNDSVNGLLSQDTTYTLELIEGTHTTIQPLFIRNGSALFRVGSNYYGFFDDALTAAGTNGTIVVHQSGTLYGSTGQTEFTINDGQKLLIPFSATDNGFFSEYPKSSSSNNAAAGNSTPPSAFRTLTIPSGTKLICNGSINVNGQRKVSGTGTDKGGTGGPAGKHGLLNLEGSGDQLIIGSTGKLYAYGFVAGTGTVKLNGGTLHELLQMNDWCGGTNANEWKGSAGYGTTSINNPDTAARTMFLSESYYVQNVEAPLIVSSGSTVNAETVVTVSSMEVAKSAPLLVKEGKGLFQLGDGTYVQRTYDPATDRVKYYLGYSGSGEGGTIGFGAITMEVSVGIITVELTSSAHTLPLNHALTVEIGDKVTVDMPNRVALMPGSEVIIDEGGTVNLSNHMYIFDKQDKNYGTTNEMFYGSDVSQAPWYTVGRGSEIKLSKTPPSAKLVVNGTLKVTDGGYIYTTTGLNGVESSNADKLIKGTGTIDHSGVPTNVGLQAGFDATALGANTISSTDALAILADTALISEMTSLTVPNVYHGIIVEKDAEGNYSIVTSTSDNPDLPNINCWYTDIDDSEGATCTTDGVLKLHCGNVENAIVVKQAKLHHDWGEPSYEWNDDKTSCTATRVCKRDETHSETATLVSVTSENTATCTEAGKIIYTATFQEDWAGSATEEVDSEPLTHDWDQVAYTWSGNYTVCTAARVCKRDNSHTESAAATGAQITAETIIPGTCETDSLVKYTATFTEPWAGSGTEEVTVTAPGHSWSWGEGVCSECNEKAIRYDAISLSIDAEILLKLKFHIHKDVVDQGVRVYVSEEANKIVPAGNSWDTALSNAVKQGNDPEKTLDNYLLIDSAGRYVVTQGIAAGEMTGNVSVWFQKDDTKITIYDNKTSESMGEQLDKSVISFAEAAQAFGGEIGQKNETLAEAAFTFGGYAQLFYGTHTEKLAYDFMKPDDAAEWKPSLDGADAALNSITQSAFSGSIGVKASTQKLNLDSKIYIRTYFTLSAGKTVNDYQVQITRPTQNGTVPVTEDGSWGEENGRIYIDIPNVPPAYWDNTYTITISDADKGTYTVQTSVLAWCARCVKASGASDEQKNMARAMYLYCQEANTYFGQTFGQDPNE